MNRTEQYILIALSIPLMISIMISDHTTTLPMGIAPMVVYIAWYYRESIKKSEKFMRLLKRVF